MKAFIARNKIDIMLSLSLAIITGFLFYYPNYAIEKNILKNKILSKHFIYSPISTAGVSTVHDELAYAEIVRAAKDGIKNLGDINIYENRNKISPLNKLPFMIAGYLSRLFGSVSSFFEFADFIFPFLSIIIGYFFLRLFLQNRLLAAWGIIIILSMFSFGQLFYVLLLKFNSAFAHCDNFIAALNVFTLKYPSFQFVFPFTFLFYYFCYKLLIRNNNIYLILTGLLAGLSGYIYLDSFLTSGLQLFFLMIWAFVQKKNDLSLRFLVAGILALLINSLYIRDVLVYASEPNHIFKLMTVSLTKSVDYNIFKTSFYFLLTSSVLLYLFWKIRSIGDKVFFILSIVIPTFLLMVLSTFFFFLPHTQHLNTFEARNIVLIALLLIITIIINKDNLQKLLPSKFYSIFERKIKLRNYAKTILMLFIIINSTQIIAAESYYLHKQAFLHYPKYTIDRDIMEAYEWLDKKASKNSVVLTIDEGEINLLPIFTGLYVYIPDAFLAESSVDETWDRVKQGFGFYGISQIGLETILRGYQPSYSKKVRDLIPHNDLDIETIQSTLIENKKFRFTRIAFSSNFYFDTKSFSFQYYHKYFTGDEIQYINDNEQGRLFYQGIYFIPHNLIMEKLADYKAELGNSKLFKYKVDYVWLGPYEKKLANIEEINFGNFKTVFRNQKVTIYKLKD